MNAVRPKFLSCPVLIEVGGTSGSGFYLSDDKEVYLVSAKHVLFKDSLETFSEPLKLTSLDAETRTVSISFVLDCQKLVQTGHFVKHQRSDVAVCRIATLEMAPPEKQTERGAVNFDMLALPGVTRELLVHSPFGLDLTTAVRTLDKITVGDPIVLFGYPTSLSGADYFEKGTPLLRTGIVAGVNSHNQMVIDCPVYFGNSGGLVAHRNPATNVVSAVGVAVKMIPFVENLYSTQFREKVGTRYENSGYALVEPMDRVLELIHELKAG